MVRDQVKFSHRIEFAAATHATTSAGRVCITGSSHEGAEQTGNTTNTSWWPAEKNPRTAIAAWPGGCDERKTLR
jgi:hypothetical protein